MKNKEYYHKIVEFLSKRGIGINITSHHDTGLTYELRTFNDEYVGNIIIYIESALNEKSLPGKYIHLFSEKTEAIYIEVVEVEPEFMGNGYARILLYLGIQEMSELFPDLDHVFLLCEPNDGYEEKLPKMYEKIGFRRSVKLSNGDTLMFKPLK